MESEKKLERLTLTEMERKLLADQDGSYRAELIEKLQRYQSDVQQHIAQGLSPEEFAVYDQLKQALLQAKEVVLNFK